MNQIKITSNTSNADQTNSKSVILEAFIPLFFRESTLQISNHMLITFRQEQHWKPNHLEVKNIPTEIDYPPEHYFS